MSEICLKLTKKNSRDHYCCRFNVFFVKSEEILYTAFEQLNDGCGILDFTSIC